MKREELAPALRFPWTVKKPYGVEKIPEEGLENIWFVTPPAPPRKLPSGLSARALHRASEALLEFPLFDQASPMERMLSLLFSRGEAVRSSRMEGTWSTIDHVLTPGEIFDEKEEKSERAAVLGYAHALDQEIAKASTLGEKIFTLDLIRRFHRAIMKKDPHYQGKPGEFRSSGKPGSVVFIGGIRRREDSVYNPTPPKRVLTCLKDHLDWLGDEELVEFGEAGMGLSLPIRIALGHAHFEAIHPFSDGNGRVGRCLLTAQMAARGRLPLYLSGHIEANKRDYYESLATAQKKLAYGPIVEFFCASIVGTLSEMRKSSEILERLPEDWRERGRFREGSGAQRGLNLLVSSPILTVKILAEHLKISGPAANRALDQLVKAGVVRERTGFGRNRVFAAEEVISVLARDFASDPKLSLSHARSLLRDR